MVKYPDGIRRRQMGGYVFHLYGHQLLKREANKLANNFRINGRVARVIKGKKGYDVWMAPGSTRKR